MLGENILKLRKKKQLTSSIHDFFVNVIYTYIINEILKIYINVYVNANNKNT